MLKHHYKASGPPKFTNEQRPLGAFLRPSIARADGEQIACHVQSTSHYTGSTRKGMCLKLVLMIRMMWPKI